MKIFENLAEYSSSPHSVSSLDFGILVVNLQSQHWLHPHTSTLLLSTQDKVNINQLIQ